MNILVTGSRGFVGQKLVNALKANGHRIREFDITLGNDITNAGGCNNAVARADVVYHLAAVLDEKSGLLHKVNVKGTENILEAAAKTQCKQFIYLSTVGVHASIKGIVNEGSKFKPVTAYEKSKADAEQVVQEFQEMLPITILRSALILGPNKYWQQIVKLVSKGFPLVGSGKQVWQTIYIDDLVSALLFVLKNDSCLGETFIVAEREKHSLRSLYEEIQRQLGMKVGINTMPVFAAKLAGIFYALRGKKSIVTAEHVERLVRERNYDTKKIVALGWQAKIRMPEAVKKTIAGL